MLLRFALIFFTTIQVLIITTEADGKESNKFRREVIVNSVSECMIVIGGSTEPGSSDPRRYSFEDFGFGSGDSPIMIRRDAQGIPPRGSYYYYYDAEDDDEDDDGDFEGHGAGYGSGESDEELPNKNRDGSVFELDAPSPSSPDRVEFHWDGVESPVMIYQPPNPAPPSTITEIPPPDVAVITPAEEAPEQPTLHSPEKLGRAPFPSYPGQVKVQHQG